MSQQELDRAIEEIRNEHIDDKVVFEAARRVFSNLFDSSVVHAQGRIKGCADYQALIPAYLDHTLTPSRALLLEDHARACNECRRAMENARRGISSEPWRTVSSKVERHRRMPVTAWALAACLAIGVAIGLTGAVKGLLPWQHTVRATVLSIEGRLYQVSDAGSALVSAGAMITNAEQLRTAKASRAILRMPDGAQVEVGERSDLSLSRGWRGTTVSLERGEMIVQASAQNPSVFYVATDNVVIPVRTGILSVNHGTKGSRIAVAKGLARVQQGQRAFELRAGQSMTTDDRLTAVPISHDFAWSKNASSYLALLGEFSALQKNLESIAKPDLRYSSNLAKYVPENTVIYAAVPNLGGAIDEAKRMFDDRLAQSEILRDWWQRQPASNAAHFDQLLAQISSISKYLGNEIVFSVAANGPGRYHGPVILAEIRQSGLRDYLEQNFSKETGFRIVENPSLQAAPNGQLLVSLSGNILVATPDAAQLQRVVQIIHDPAAGQFVHAPFYDRIEKSYNAGAGYLLSVDMEQIAPKSVSTPSKQNPVGLNNVQYAVLEKRDVTDKSEIRAALWFAGSRKGVASWLAAPGAMGSLDFVSPDASFATSFILKNPRTLMEELVSFGANGDSRFSEQLKSFESEAGVNLLDDVAAPLGSDVTFAVDGPLLPVPAWKLAVEVYDPVHLQQTLSTLIDRFNQQSPTGAGKLRQNTEEINSRTFYSLKLDKFPNAGAVYTFVDGYLLAGPSKADLIRAMQDRESGHTLVRSPKFRAELPDDGYTNFSGMIYNNVGRALAPIADELKGTGSLSPAQQESISALVANTGPSLICVYGEPDRIIVASRSGFLGFNLSTLAQIQQGRPLLPLIAAAGVASRVGSASRPQQQRR